MKLPIDIDSIKKRAIKKFCFSNWAETFFCSPELYFAPKSEEEIIDILHLARVEKKCVRVAGKAHSPSDLACTTDYMISLQNMNKVLSVDEEKCIITVEAGITFKELNEIHLPKHNMALSVLGSISEVTVAGALSTATHGTGITFGNFATSVLNLELITCYGEKIHCSHSENQDLFLSALSGLGALGIILNLTIQCEPAFFLEKKEFDSTLNEVLQNLDSFIKSAEHFRFNWFPHTDYVLITQTSRTKERPKAITNFRRVINWFWDYAVGYYTLEFCYWISTFLPALVPMINKAFFNILHRNVRTKDVGISHQIFNIECLFKQYVTEWAIPVEETSSVLRALKKWLDNGTFYAHFPVEVRFCQKDDIFISPAYGRDTCYINIIMYRPYGKYVPYQEYWHYFENLMLQAEGRPHWAKEHSLNASSLRLLYPKFDTWTSVRARVDPLNMFSNAYIHRILN